MESGYAEFEKRELSAKLKEKLNQLFVPRKVRSGGINIPTEN